MPKNKTTETDNSVTDYIEAIADQKRREDFTALVQLFTEHSGLPAKMWGTGIVGFGSYHYKYDSGHEGDAPLAGLACRANAISIYLAQSFTEKEELLKQLGKHKTGKGCIYVKKLEDVNTKVLGQMVELAIEQTKKKYPQ